MSEELKIEADKFFERLDKLVNHWQSQKSSLWGGSDALCIPYGTRQESGYSKAQAFHLYFFGMEELADSIIVLTRTEFYFMANAKKCNFLKDQLSSSEKKSEKIVNFHYLEKAKDTGMIRENFNRMMGAVRKGNGKSMGSFYKEQHEGSFIPMWTEFVNDSQIEKVDAATGFGLFLAIKDETELELCRRASVLTNKILKHTFVDEMENILLEKKAVAHEELSKRLEETILDPNKIGIKISPSAVDICYTPIVQSNGEYDIKLSASSSKNNLAANVILCSLGARYKSYCATMSRTYLVDPPKKIEEAYKILLKLFHHCLEQMTPGNELKKVFLSAKEFLTKKKPELLSYLPKTLGFSIGIEFRDSSMVLNHNNDRKFSAGMVFNLSVGFSNVPLEAKERSGNYKAVEMFSLLISDVVVVQLEGVPDILTKAGKELDDVVYNPEAEDDEGEGEDADDAEQEPEEEEDNGRRRTRGAINAVKVQASETARYQRQKELLERRNEEGRKRMQNGGADVNSAQDQEIVEAKDLKVYKTPQEMPRDLVPNRLKIDMEHEALIIPLNGRHVPFHITTVKSMALTEGDLRVVFYSSGSTLGKDAPKNIQALVAKYGPTCAFVKELTFRSGDDKNLSLVYQQFQEVRKRIRQREQKADQEKDLVVQANLIKIRDQKIARLVEVTMRPVISGRKCVGSLEAHQNGLRFVSNKGETVDVMYANIKHCVFQPCEKTSLVLIHYNLKNPIMVGKKKVADIQFNTEVFEASENLESHKHSHYDPDELEEEQRLKEMQKKLNKAFKDFCLKVEQVAEHFNYNVKVDIPFKLTSFQGHMGRELGTVTFMPTTYCLVSLVEWPAFVLTLSEVEHCHLERVTYSSRSFDMVFIFKDWEREVVTINSVDIKSLELVEEWLLSVEISTTKGPKSLNFKEVMRIAREEKQFFYDTHDEDGTPKAAGWLNLTAEGDDDEDDDDDDDDVYSSDDSDEEEEDSDDSDGSSDFTEEDSDDYGEDDDELSEQGQVKFL